MQRLLLLLTWLAGPAQASGALCDRAAEGAAFAIGVPLDLMRAITRVETGRDGTPWPWTLNLDGESRWFVTAPDAIDAARAAIAQGAAQIDVGCFQLNLHWHGPHFTDLEEMIDPTRNARYAAQFLSELHAELGDWRAAAAAFHSRTPERGEAYLARIEAAHAAGADGETQAASLAEPRVNRFPLLVAGAVGTFGSLVPRTGGVSPLIGGP
jgi:hypothetical protein